MGDDLALQDPRTGQNTKKRLFRGDAGFAKPEFYEFLEQQGYQYAIGLPANNILHSEIAFLLKRPVGRPPRTPVICFTSFDYRAATWERSRRVVAKVEWHRVSRALFREILRRIERLKQRPLSLDSG